MNVVIRLTLAAISAMIGLAGLLLPILPGWLFLGIALLLIFPDAPLARKVFAKIEHRWPRAHRLLRFFIDE